MEITLGLIFIFIATLVSFWMIGYSICVGSEGFVISGVGLFILVCLAVFIRAEQIDNEKKYELCVKQGKHVVKVFDQKVCKL